MAGFPFLRSLLMFMPRTVSRGAKAKAIKGIWEQTAQGRENNALGFALHIAFERRMVSRHLCLGWRTVIGWLKPET
jgi:hypothetical protein